MSILIKGMEMPKDCFRCPIWDSEYGRCRVTARITNCKKDCPLVEIPVPHGRLGDLDALESKGADLCCDNGYYGSTEWGFSYEMIENAPTIIEAEGKDDG